MVYDATVGHLGYESAVINGQLINIPPMAGYDPLIFGGAFTGPAWPRQGVWDVPPVIPSAATADYGLGGTGSYPTATDENGSPWSVTKSPVLWVLGFLAAALLFLHYVVYK
jgi:hypothetical protein